MNESEFRKMREGKVRSPPNLPNKGGTLLYHVRQPDIHPETCHCERSTLPRKTIKYCFSRGQSSRFNLVQIIAPYSLNIKVSWGFYPNILFVGLKAQLTYLESGRGCDTRPSFKPAVFILSLRENL